MFFHSRINAQKAIEKSREMYYNYSPLLNKVLIDMNVIAYIDNNRQF